jgi:hypothetical protein
VLVCAPRARREGLIVRAHHGVTRSRVVPRRVLWDVEFVGFVELVGVEDGGVVVGPLGEGVDGAGGGVDLVVVDGVGEEDDFVEERVVPGSADEADFVVFGAAGEGLRSDDFVAGGAIAVHAVAVQDVGAVVIDDGLTGRSGFFFNGDGDVAAVMFGSGAHVLNDLAGRVPESLDVDDVVALGVWVPEMRPWGLTWGFV